MHEARLARLAIAAAAGLWVSLAAVVLQPSYGLTGRSMGLLEMPTFTTILIAGTVTAIVTYFVTRNRRALEVVVSILLVVAIWSVFAALWPSINPFSSSAPDIRNPALD